MTNGESGVEAAAGTPVTVRAHGKINLSLRILGTRPDGFHDVETVLQSIALHDTLTLASHPGPFVLDCATTGVPSGPSNLVWRAAAALWQALGRDGAPRDVTVQLGKSIRTKAGLGGGSADAAAALLALNRLWGTGLPVADLARVAAQVGSDVPFFLHGGTALGVGRGDEIRLLDDAPARWLVIVLPGFGVPTARAYGWYDEDIAGGAIAPRFAQGAGDATLVNDLEGVVSWRYPEIRLMKGALAEVGAGASLLCGSGSAVFGVFESEAAAVVAAGVLRRRGWETVVSRTLSRPEYQARIFA